MIGLEALFSIGSKLIDRFFPDPIEAEKAKLKLVEMQQSGELEVLRAETSLAQGQLEINKEEAKSSNLFVAGWRPAIGWTAAISLFVYYVPYCLIATFLWAHQVWVTGQLVSRPDLGIADLIGLVAAMLGIAGLRTAEKFKGVAQ